MDSTVRESALPYVRIGVALIVLFLSCSALLSCSSGGDDDDDSEHNESTDDSTGDTSNFALTGTTDANGFLALPFNIDEGVTKFAITAQSTAPLVLIDSLTSPAGIEQLLARAGVSRAGTFEFGLSVANVPAADTSPSVIPGVYTVSIIAALQTLGLDYVPASSSVAGIAITSSGDSDFSAGALPVNVFFVTPISADSSVVSAVEAALTEWQRIYQDEANISVELTLFDIAGPVALPLPFFGDQFYLDASSSVASPAINVFIGEDTDNIPGDSDSALLGISPGIPGPPIPTQKSALAVSIIDSAGPNGEFSAEEILVLGETLAHETGHYLGVFHPIELDSSPRVTDVDPLDDTPTCATQAECYANPDLTHNLMFPFPVLDESGSFIRQNILTGQQAGVMNRYVVVQ